MMRTALLVIALLPALSLAISKINFNGLFESILVSTADFGVKSTIQLLDGDWNVYVTSSEVTNYLKQVKITSYGTIVKEHGLDEFLRISPDGRLIATPLSNVYINVTDYSRVPGKAVILFIRQYWDTAPIYDATLKSRSITSDDKWAVSGVTFLSAGPYFTLSNFNFASSAAGIAVHGSPFNVAEYTGDPIIEIGKKEYAKKSFVTIIGPIATVSVMKPYELDKKTFSVSSDTSNFISASYLRFTGVSFAPDSQFSISSPGLISINRLELLPHFFEAKRMIGDWKTAHDSLITYDIRVAGGYLSSFNFKSIDRRGFTTTTNNGVTQRNVETIANEFKLDYNITDHYSRFLIQITSKLI